MGKDSFSTGMIIQGVMETWRINGSEGEKSVGKNKRRNARSTPTPVQHETVTLGLRAVSLQHYKRLLTPGT